MTSFIRSVGCLLAASTLLTGCPKRPAGPLPAAMQLRVITIPTAEPAAYRRDEYLQLVASRTNVTRDPESPFWRTLRHYFVDRNNTVLLAAAVKMNGRQFGVFPLYTLKTSTLSQTTTVVSNMPLAAPLRLQDADDFSIHVSLAEATKDQEEQLLKLLKTATTTGASLPISAVVPAGETALGAMSAAMNMMQTLAKPTDTTLEVEEHVNPLWRASHLVILPAHDIERFRAEQARLLSADWVPRHDDPTFVALRVERKEQLYTPDLALGPSSPVRDKVSRHLNELKSAGDEEKVFICRRLRTYLQSDLGLNAKDETAVVLGAMKEAGYDPDRSRAHLRGCLTADEIDAARRAGFRWGSCADSTACRLALAFADAWVNRKPFATLSTVPVSWYDHLFENGRRRDDDPIALAEDLTLFPNYALPTLESESTAALVGYVGRPGGEARKARVLFSVAGTGPDARIGRIDLCDATAAPAQCLGAPVGP